MIALQTGMGVGWPGVRYPSCVSIPPSIEKFGRDLGCGMQGVGKGHRVGRREWVMSNTGAGKEGPSSVVNLKAVIKPIKSVCFLFSSCMRNLKNTDDEILFPTGADCSPSLPWA